MNINFDNIQYKLANLFQKPVQLEGNSQEKIDQALAIIYQITVTSSEKNLIDKKFTFEKVDSILREIEGNDKSPEHYAATCRIFLDGKKKEVNDQITAEEEERVSHLLASFKKGFEELNGDIRRLDQTPQQLDPYTINKRLANLFDTLPKSVISDLINSKDKIIEDASKLFFETMSDVLTKLEPMQINECIFSATRIDPNATASVLVDHLNQLIEGFDARIRETFQRVPCDKKILDYALENSAKDRFVAESLIKKLSELKPHDNYGPSLANFSKIELLNSLQQINRELNQQFAHLQNIATDFLNTKPDDMAAKLDVYSREQVAFIRNMVGIKRIYPDFNPMESEAILETKRVLDAIKILQDSNVGMKTPKEVGELAARMEDGKMFVYFDSAENIWKLSVFQNKAATSSKLTLPGILNLHRLKERNVLIAPENLVA